MECGDLLPLWSGATCRDPFAKLFTKAGRQAAQDESGDRSPHCKKVCRTLCLFWIASSGSLIRR